MGAGLRGIAALLVVGLTGCQLLGLDGGPEQPRSEDLEGRSQNLLAYPDLHTVPPRPQLSYSVEQQREIVERLISDREHARYTDRMVRYESGLSSLPPPPEPPQALADGGAEVDQIVRATPQAPTPRPEAMPATRAAQTQYRVDNDSLGAVMRDLARDTAPPAAAAAPSAAPASPPAPGDEAPVPSAPTEQGTDDPPASSPPQDEARSLGERLFGWLSDLFDGQAAAEPATEPPARPGDRESPPAAVAEPAASGAAAHARPLLKPTLVAEPPRPSPSKPQGALAAGTVDAGAAGTEQRALAVIPFSPGSALLGPGYDAVLGRAWATIAGAPVEVRARGGGRALAVDRARAVALALVRAGASPDDLELVVSGIGPDEVRVVPVAEPF